MLEARTFVVQLDIVVPLFFRHAFQLAPFSFIQFLQRSVTCLGINPFSQVIQVMIWDSQIVTSI